MNCPKCKETNIQFSREYAGTHNRISYRRTGVKNSWFVPAGISEGTESASYRTVAMCRNCGYTWTVSSLGTASSALNLLIIIGLILLYLLIIKFLTLDVNGRTKETERITTEITTEAELPVSNDPTVIYTNQEIDTDIWQEEYTSIEDFDWYVDENGITLKDYKQVGRDKKIRLSDRYTINDIDYHITKLDGCFFCDDIKSVIVPEGVTEIVRYTFNSCKIEYLYLPASLEEFDGWTYLHDLKVLYYGGTEEQWNEKFSTGEHLKSVTIEYNADPADLK